MKVFLRYKLAWLVALVVLAIIMSGSGNAAVEKFDDWSLGTISFPVNDWTLNNSTTGVSYELISAEGFKILKGTATEASLTPHIVSKSDIGGNNYAISARVKSDQGDNRVGVIARWTDNRNFYCLFYRKNVLYLSGKVGGATTDITSADIRRAIPKFNFAKYHQIKLVVSGANPIKLQGYIDDRKLIEVNDTDQTRLAGYGGIYGALKDTGNAIYWGEVTVNVE
jgi:hypothetical protein